MSCGTCGLQASNTMQGDTGVPAGAPQTKRPRCHLCGAFLRQWGAVCRNPRCPSYFLAPNTTRCPACGTPLPPGPEQTTVHCPHCAGQFTPADLVLSAVPHSETPASWQPLDAAALCADPRPHRISGTAHSIVSGSTEVVTVCTHAARSPSGHLVYAPAQMVVHTQDPTWGHSVTMTLPLTPTGLDYRFQSPYSAAHSPPKKMVAISPLDLTPTPPAPDAARLQQTLRTIETPVLAHAAPGGGEFGHLVDERGTIVRTFFHRPHAPLSLGLSEEDMRDMAGKVFTHNHPTTTACGGGLSPADLITARRAHLAQMRAYGYEEAAGPCYVYTVAPPPAGWASLNLTPEQWRYAILTTASSARSSSTPASPDHRRPGNQSAAAPAATPGGHEMCRQLAACYGLIYTRTPLSPPTPSPAALTP